VVLNITTWAKLAATKAVAGDGAYFSGGPYSSAANTPWGLRTIISGKISDGEALVGAFGTAAQIFRKGGPTLDVSNSHADYFQRDLSAVRVEERLGLVLYRPSAFCLVTAS
jgi:HK97 family phage major capsid protein